MFITRKVLTFSAIQTVFHKKIATIEFEEQTLLMERDDFKSGPESHIFIYIETDISIYNVWYKVTISGCSLISLFFKL